ncbi:non-ribosomal peptide synthetase [Hyalangium rubrum]|uniref:Amino acid adenylation domain-containing protein n=1 Tax=Hyalangium rubrum TaxID=3103134 RepID=A0ABU5GXA3_9BACT|nr:non-ribosomal peptide synthetase [Hyalangium sp. s54d21]MDY7225118.1 amino acid adenylation domain-containing protein [Hyalangium sp. s54d21]
MTQRRDGNEAQPRQGQDPRPGEQTAPPAKRKRTSFPLSFGQQRLWVLDQFEPGSPLYNVSGALRMRGRLDVAALERSLNEIIARHEALRSTFTLEQGVPMQLIAPTAQLPLPVVDLSNLEPEAREHEVQRLGGQEARRGFDLAQGPLMRAQLLRLSPTEHVLLLTMHHIASDGWSVGVFFKELAALYGAFSQGRPSPLKPLPIQYVDYAAWQRKWLQGEALEKHLRFWKQRLSGVEPLDLKTDRPRGAQGSRGARHHLRLSRELTEGLRALGRRRGATLFMTLLAGFKALLWRYTRQDDIVVGTSVANRNRPELEGLIGFFVNTLALRTDLTGDVPFTELLERVRKGTVEAYAHQDTPFDRVVEAVQPERDLTRSPLFQVMFELQPSPDQALQLPGVALELADLETGTAKFDLLFTMEEGAHGLKGTVEYDAHLFDAETIARMVGHFEVLLSGAVTQPQTRLSALPLLTAPEQQQLVVDWNQTQRPSEQEGLFCELFEAQVARTPEARAVVCEGQALTYAELNARANQVAHALQAQGAGPERIVGVLQDRGNEYLISLLGILKAGAVYVPLDPALPNPRLATIVQQSGCGWVLTEQKYLARATELTPASPVLDVAALLGAGHPTRNPEHRVDPKGLAYVIFTSGSTGLPKGAMIEHRGMKNHLLAKVDDLALGPQDVVAQVAVQSFDVSIWQFLCALLVGGCTAVFRDEKAWEPVQLLRQMAQDGVTLLETVPSHMKLIVEELEARKASYDLSALRWFFLNGEALPSDLCVRWFQLYPHIPMVNAYGPTECSDDVTHYKMLVSPPTRYPWMPINGTLPNLRIYVLDPWQRPVPVGVIGELCVGGVGVGRGYLGDPGRTATIYVPDPFSTEPGARLYRTGDVVRYRNDGTIEFLGRSDHQVKIRGIRIEIGEIESALRKHLGVGTCVVLARQDGGQEKRLVAYVTPREGQPPAAPHELAEFLKAQLSTAMVPSAFVQLEALPLTLNGKVDRKALPAPSGDQAAPARAYLAPSTPTEQQVAALWQELLGVNRVGADDNFFDLGGHSLAAIQLISRLRTALGVELSIREVFEGPTVAQVAGRIDARSNRPGSALFLEHPLVRLPPQEHAPLSTVQLPEWYMFELEPQSALYNVNVSDVQLVGEVDVAAFVRAWQTLIARHSALRTWFGYVDGKPVQRVLPRLDITREDIYVDCRHVPEEQVDAELERRVSELNNAPFDLKRAPVFRLKLLEFPGKRFQFVFVTHHIVWDEVSTMNMARELAELYRAYTSGREPELPELKVEYTDYAHWLQGALASGRLEPQRQYWLKQLTPVPPALDLPTDFPRPHLQTFNGDTVSSQVPAATMARLAPFLAEHNVTPFIFYLAVLNLQLHRLSRQRDFVIGTPIANRDDAAMEPMLGLFATAMPMRCRLERELSFLELLQYTREASIDAYENHLYPSVLAIQEVNPQLDLSRNRLFSVMYGVQNNKTRLMSQLSFGELALRFTNFESPEFQNARFDLTYVVDQLGEDTLVQLNYNKDLFLRASAERMLEQFFSLTDQVVREPGKPLWAYRMLSEQDGQQALRRLAGPELPLAPEPGGIHTRLSAQARRTPDAVALESEHGQVTYRQLEETSDRWAHWLIARGVRAEERVALLFEPSVEMVTAMLAVLKAGATYVPLHPDHPAERQAHVFERSGARLLLTHGALDAPVLQGREGVVRMEVHAAEVAKLPTGTPAREVLADQLAYILYTSGTTGTPKGIEIAHRGLHNLLDSTQRDYDLGAKDAVLFITPFDFDASILDLFWPLSVGARVVLPQAGEGKSPERLAARVARHGVTVFQTVPLMLDALVKAQRAGGLPPLPSLRVVICGGAYLTRELRDRFRATFPCRLVNHYGPTEVTVDATRFDCAEPVDAEIVPIGRPLANTQVRVLDEHLQPVPPGVKGELFVSSPGLARGYSGDPVRTALQFIPDPYATVPGSRMYRTGDLGRYSDEGTLHFVARVDKQVKVRGNRVELEEVESRLTALPPVARGVVRHQPLPGGGDTLVAYVELRERFSRLRGDTAHRLYTLAQRPELRRPMDALHADSWPEYFLANRAVRELWPRLATEFPDYQLALVNEQGAVVGVGNAIPFAWDGSPEGLPRGWDEALERAFSHSGREARPNTLLMLTVVVAQGVHGQGLSALMLRALKNLGHVHKLERLVVAVRPVGKVEHPELDLEVYCHQRREDGLLRDNWLRTHERLGARILRVEPRSQHVVAPLADWQRWSGQSFTASGNHPVREALLPVRIDVEAGVGEYHDPSVWMEHPHSPPEEYTWSPVDGQALRLGLREFLPEYMIPEHYRFLPTLPLTESGKVDERALPELPLGPVHHEHVPPQTELQHRLAGLWCKVLELERIGITDDFFELGGHSIRAIQLLAKVNEAFGVSVALKDLLRERTIRGMEKRIIALRAPPSPSGQEAA